MVIRAKDGKDAGSRRVRLRLGDRREGASKVGGAAHGVA